VTFGIVCCAVMLKNDVGSKKKILHVVKIKIFRKRRFPRQNILYNINNLFCGCRMCKVVLECDYCGFIGFVNRNGNCTGNEIICTKY
jgi:hypothetical protein